MPTSQNTSKQSSVDLIWATLMFFTRLPFWRFKSVSPECFKHVVDYWSLVGWLTGGVMALTFWLTSMFFPSTIAVWFAVGARLLLTGALHEDGLADFADGFGGGNSRERILAIMKDSHIGTYGVLGLIFYAGLLTNTLKIIPLTATPLLLLCGDIYAKACSSIIIRQLPYARTIEQSKAHVIYEPWYGKAALYHLLRCLICVLPAVMLLYEKTGLTFFWAFIAPPVIEILLFYLMKRRIQGYTGDCCGATFLLSELGFYLTATAAGCL